MGKNVGDGEGFTVGLLVGLTVGDADGFTVGTIDGLNDGRELGADEREKSK